jgi:hypothetical protein
MANKFSESIPIVRASVAGVVLSPLGVGVIFVV